MKDKVIYFLLSIVIAFGLWAYVVTNVSVEETTTIHNVPVVFQNEGALSGRNLMLTEGTAQTVSLTVTGTRSEILKLNNNNVSVIVDLSRIYDAGRQNVQYTVNYPSDVVTSSFEYTADKTRIPLTVESRVSKQVDVVHSYTGQVAEGYMVDFESVLIDYRKVTVTGPASVVENIDQAKFTIDLEGMSGMLDQEYDYTLCDEAGEVVEVPNVDFVHTDVEKIRVSMSIPRYKEIALTLNIIDGGGATEETSSIVMDIETIVVSGSDAALEGLESLQIGEIDLAEQENDITLVFPLTMPAGVTNRTGVDMVTVKVSFPALVTKTFTISNIQPVNVAEGAEAIVVTKQVTVTVRGPSSIIQRMKATDIAVTVDFSSMSIGSTVTMQPTISVSSNYSAVGILDNGQVTVTMQELPPETEPPVEEEPTEAAETTQETT